MMSRARSGTLCIFAVIECIAANSSLRIFGGRSIIVNEYPYVVRMEIITPLHNDNGSVVLTQHKHLCTASALSPTWVLSAAHCLHHLRYSYKTPVVRYGHETYSPLKNPMFSEVLSAVAHPLYMAAGPGRRNLVTKNDIGLVKTTPMNIESYCKLSAVDYFTLYGHEIIITGFGITNKTLPDGGKIVAGTTLKLEMPLQVLKVLFVKCRRDRLMPGFCLGLECGHGVKTVCGGDSGSPLFHPSGQIGVVSLGEKTRYCMIPTRKTRVYTAGHGVPISPYIEWIRGYVAS